MTPTFLDFFKSCYQADIHLSPVDLSDEGLKSHLLEDPAEATVAQKLISDPEVQAVLSEPLTYDLAKEVPEKNAILSKHGFRLLSSKPVALTGQRVPFYSVVEHDQLPGWIIKSGATRVPKGQLLIGPMNNMNEMAFFTDEESLLRIEMANRIRRIAQKAKIEVVIPEKKLVAYRDSKGATEPTRKYCVVCKKIKILSVEDTVKAIKNMDAEQQKEVAKNISTIVQKVGLVDASFDNIRLTPDGKLAFIDTEPTGLMVAKKSGLWNMLSSPKGASVEKCARIGLFTLMHQTSKNMRGTGDTADVEPGLEAFRTQVKSDYEKASTPKLSKWKIVLSVVSIGIIPLINAVVALVKTKLTKWTFERLSSLDTEFSNKIQNQAPFLSQDELTQLLKEYQEKRTPVAKQFFAYIEDVPYTSVLAQSTLPKQTEKTKNHDVKSLPKKNVETTKRYDDNFDYNPVV